MGAIYKITNNINGKVYIGQTTRPVQVRWSEHLRESRNPNPTIPLYQAMKKYGIENFSFNVIESNISNEQLSDKERFYINKFHSLSHDSGYNVTEGGEGGITSSKLDKQDVKEIIQMLKDKECLLSYSEIAKMYGVSMSRIECINNGTGWRQDNIIYPIRNYSVVGLTIPRAVYTEIVNDIKNTDISLKEIGKKYKISEGQLTNINQGYECYNGKHNYYKDIYSGPFPIRPDTKTKSDASVFIDIFYDVLFTSDSMAKIGERHGVLGNTIQCVISGKRRKELTKDFILPMRKHIQENQCIFKKLYPNYKEGL